jgi:hypothetical protein
MSVAGIRPAYQSAYLIALVAEFSLPNGFVLTLALTIPLMLTFQKISPAELELPKPAAFLVNLGTLAPQFDQILYWAM